MATKSITSKSLFQDVSAFGTQEWFTLRKMCSLQCIVLIRCDVSDKYRHVWSLLRTLHDIQAFQQQTQTKLTRKQTQTKLNQPAQDWEYSMELGLSKFPQTEVVGSEYSLTAFITVWFQSEHLWLACFWVRKSPFFLLQSWRAKNLSLESYGSSSTAVSRWRTFASLMWWTWFVFLWCGRG